MNLWTIAPGNDFLAVLAAAVEGGSLLDGKKEFTLPDWTILVPTRRAARALSKILLMQSGRKALLLPRIRPIGDIDEDNLADSVATDELPAAISTAGLTHLLMELLFGWAARNPHLELARDISRSPEQALQLTLSLQQLLNQVETEETDFSNLPLAYELDLAGHRAAILDLLDVLSKDFPQRLHGLDLISPATRRNKLLHLEAQRIADGGYKGAIVAAGSTGTNPAARELLRAIALCENGAVILPGLDCALDEEAWKAITPQHPQHAMKQLLEQWQVSRQSVKPLGTMGGTRQETLSAVMRPAEATDSWHASKPRLPDMGSMELVEARDRHEEALVIALRLKKFLAEEQGTAALITPDRDLARRVVVALRRWDIAIDDSSGEPLVERPPGSLLVLLIRAWLSDFSPPEFLALIHHPLATFGIDGERVGDLKERLDACCFRGLPSSHGLGQLQVRIDAARERAADPHAHPMLKRLDANDWEELKAFASSITATLSADNGGPMVLAGHVRRLRHMLSRGAAGTDLRQEAETSQLLETLAEEKAWREPVTFRVCAPVILHHLSATTARPPLADTRIAILGLPEARLVPLDLAILGGLNDGSWPQLAETGPWLNRSMRETLSLSQPERNIGITAHDFVQGLGRPRAMVTWSQRIGGKPALPSRWILRLRAVLQLAGLAPERQLSQELPLIARRLDAAGKFAPWQRPAAKPAIAFRPTSFSVTEIETLLRDSYAVFARRVLGLEPLEDADEEPDARLRGTLVHEALGRWLQDSYHADDGLNLKQLLARGQEAFAPYSAMPEVARLWWPRFERMARALVEIERRLRADLAGARIETKGAIQIAAGGVEHRLRARADRIDMLQDGSLRIIDYKTGDLPTWDQVASKFSPQLTLEAAMAERGGFGGLEGAVVSELGYVQVGGGKEPADLKLASEKLDIHKTAEDHLQSLARLLAEFQLPSTAYMPRHNLFKDEERSSFDHLSRRGEWQLAQRSKP